MIKRILPIICFIAMLVFTVGCKNQSQNNEGKYDYRVGQKIIVEEYKGDTDKTVRYFYIAPDGDMRELTDDLSFTAKLSGKYVIRYYLTNREAEIEILDRVYTVG